MPKRARQIIFPTAEDPILNEAIASFRKRARAIRHSGGEISIQRVIERNGGEELEKVEIRLTSSLGPQAALFLWSDRWVQVHAGHLAKQGWLWEWMKEGRLVGSDKVRTICRNLEKMLDAAFGTTNPGQFCDALWRSTIATGPAAVAP